MINIRKRENPTPCSGIVVKKVVSKKTKVGKKKIEDDLDNEGKKIYDRVLKVVTEQYDIKLQDITNLYDAKFKDLQESIISETFLTDKLKSEGRKTKDIFHQQLNILPSLVSKIVDDKNKVEIDKLRKKTELLEKEIDNQLKNRKSTYSKSDFLASFLHVCEHLNFEDELKNKSTLTNLRFMLLNNSMFILLLCY